MYKLILVIFLIISNVSFGADLVKLTPKIRIADKVNEQQRDKDLPQWEKSFLNIQILNQEQLNKMPSVVSNNYNTLMSINNDVVYVNNIDQINYKKNLAIYRLDEPIVDTEYRLNKLMGDAKPNKIIGYSLVFIADAKLKQLNIKDKISSVSLSNIVQEVLPGDKLLIKHSQNSAFKLVNKDNKKIKGKIVSIVGGVTYPEMGRTVVINLGKKSNIKKGTILSVVNGENIHPMLQIHEKQKPGLTIDLPKEKTGSVLVYDVFDGFSLALVIAIDRLMAIGQSVVN